LSQNQKSAQLLHSVAQFGRFVLSVDGQRKSGFSDRVAADGEAAQLKAAFPNLHIRVIDQRDEVIRERADEQS
jgi:hypothetical protein